MAVEIQTRSLADIENDLQNLAPKHAELRERRRSGGEVTDALLAEERAALADIYNLDAEHKIATLSAELNARGTGPAAALLAGSPEVRSAGWTVQDDDAFRKFTERGARGSVEVEVRNLLTTSTSAPGAGLFAPVGQPVLVNQRRQRLFVRDVMNVVPTTLGSVPYIKELNALTNETGATAVAEGAAKPEVTMEFERDDAPIRKIAAWIRATTEELSDAPLVRGYIDGRLSYMLALREEVQILKGPGTSPNIRGIMETTGTQTQSFATDQATTIGKAIGKVENVDGYPNAVALNPVDFWELVVLRSANQFDGAAFGNAPFGAPLSTIWGLQAVRTRSMTSGEALVGDFLQGATLLDRESTTIRLGDQHSDYFVSNLVAILAEERVGLAVHRPDFFVECDVSP
jgi:HK97 family phage major capsid protein